MTDDLDQLEKELREISEVIALIKSEYNALPDGQEKEDLLRTFKDKQWQALFYIEKIRNLDVKEEVLKYLSQLYIENEPEDIIIQEDNEAWKAALSGVVGVYVIVDSETGKLYIGSANSEMGIWGRWCEYSATGHGGNRELRKLLAAKGNDYAENFQYGILEIADTHATAEHIFQRESRWKTLLMTRTHGYNAN